MSKNAPLFWEDMPVDDQELIKYFLRQGLYYFASNTGADHWRFFQRVTQQKLVLIKCIFSVVSNDFKGLLGTSFMKMSGVLTQEFAFTLHSLFLTCIDLECFESGVWAEKRGKFKLSIFSKSPKSNPTTFGVLVKMANNPIAELIAKFKLEGHPEGGYPFTNFCFKFFRARFHIFQLLSEIFSIGRNDGHNSRAKTSNDLDQFSTHQRILFFVSPSETI